VAADRKLSDAARAALAELFGIPEFRDAWASILCVFSESELQGCERAIGLDRPNPEFRAGIVDAVAFCIWLHAIRPRRYSEIREEFILVAKRAEAAALALQQLSAALDPSSRNLLLEPLADVFATLIAPSAPDHLRELAATAKRFAESLRGRDQGGAARMHAFAVLIRLLADAFTRATGDGGEITYSPYRERYEGRFWNLVEAVLSKVETIAEQGGRRLARPATKGARGKYIERVLRGVDKTPTVAP
jgi:hypothetical protein